MLMPLKLSYVLYFVQENPFYVAKRGDEAVKDGKHADLKHKVAKKK